MEELQEINDTLKQQKAAMQQQNNILREDIKIFQEALQGNALRLEYIRAFKVSTFVVIQIFLAFLMHCAAFYNGQTFGFAATFVALQLSLRGLYIPKNTGPAVAATLIMAAVFFIGL